MQKKRERLVSILVIVDTLLMYLSVFLSLLIRYWDLSFLSTEVFRNHIIAFSFIQLFWIIFLYLLDFYEIPPVKDLARYFSHLFIFMLLCFATGSVYFYLLPGSFITPKTILFIDVVVLALSITIFRLLFTSILSRRGIPETVVFICSQEEINSIESEALEGNRYKLLWSFEPIEIQQYTEFKEFMEETAPDLVVMGNDLYRVRDLASNIFTYLPLGLNYIGYADFYERLYKKTPIEDIREIWLLENLGGKLDLRNVSKRAFDLLFSSLGLIMTIVFIAPIAVLIKLTSKGPVFYRQERVGSNGNPFLLYKFRTMYGDAEANGPQWSDKNDPRITGFGKFLRAAHIDEFPQFYNVLKGELSFVGPRPERPEFVETLREEIPYYDLRHTIKPGLTGWAQINYDYGNSITDARVKLQYDIYYITHRSIALDLGIILKTLRHLFYR